MAMNWPLWLEVLPVPKACRKACRRIESGKQEMKNENGIWNGDGGKGEGGGKMKKNHDSARMPAAMWVSNPESPEGSSGEIQGR